MMKDQYETSEKARKYDLFKKNLFLSKIEQPSIHKLLDYNLEGKRVLDLACGTGDSTKMLAVLNPREIIGVDYSFEMIKTANELTTNQNAIKYEVKDCSKPLGLGEFDVVFAAHLLNYASNEEILLNFYKCMFDSTELCGICCGVMMNIFLDREEFKVVNRYKKYGLEYFMHEDNQTLDIKFFYENEYLFDIKVWVWPPHVHEKCAREVGFKKVEFIKPSLDKNYNDEAKFFDTFLQFSPTVFYKFSK
jgi:SAM-dependent methyltransferase